MSEINKQTGVIVTEPTGKVIVLSHGQIRQHDRDYRKWLITNGKLVPKVEDQ